MALTAERLNRLQLGNRENYSEILSNRTIFPLAFETVGPMSQAGCDILSSLGRRPTLVSDDPRESSFLS